MKGERGPGDGGWTDIVNGIEHFSVNVWLQNGMRLMNTLYCTRLASKCHASHPRENVSATF